MSKDRFLQLCEKALDAKGFSNDPVYKRRFKWEVQEVICKEKFDYFLDLYDRKIRYAKNENNLLICWLLEIVPDFEIGKEPSSVFLGDLPDIDVDYIPMVRDYLKNEWAPKTFGAEHVCNIGNYTTFGIKSALIDMVRVFDGDRDEIMAITKTLETKDDEGKPLTWDTALNLYPELKKFTDKNPEIADATRKIINRNRGMGVHAGGLIVSSKPLHDLVPLVKRKDSPHASAWVEGLHGQDLQPVGLIKFDLLVISNLLQIARCCEMVKNRHGVEGICNKPGKADWTDVDKWRNDSKSLAMANSGDLKCIFQFDSEGMRALVRSGGVERFEDMVAYSALFRPGCLASGMTKRYVERKQGREKYNLHPLIEQILEKTYGVMVYQEQIMRMLHVVGDIPLKDCESIRKAISKKKLESFIKYKERFILNGQKNLQATEEDLIQLWAQIETFSEYGFNLSHAVAYNYVSANLLYLKAHYPHEFYASMLGYETLSDKIKDYKMEARIHGVDMHRLDINKSGVNFELKGDRIYFGFSNVKGIGEGPAEKIVKNQPYKSFEDFISRCSTDASVLKPIIGLRCFRDSDPITLWKFADYFKDNFKKFEAKKKRIEESIIRYEEDFQELAPDSGVKLSDLSGDAPFDNPEWQEKYDYDDFVETEKETECDPPEGIQRIVVESVPVEGTDITIDREVVRNFKIVKISKKFNRWKELRRLWQRRIKTFERRENITVCDIPRLVDFKADDHDIPSDLLKELRDPILCEEKYYGFAWIHDLERSPDYRGNLTFDCLRNDIDQSVTPVEMRIKKSTEITSKKGTAYRQIVAEDVTGQENRINIWAEDWKRWSKEFVVGNLLRVRLQPPSNGFNTFTLEANQVGKFRGQLRYRDKEDDPRVFVMKIGKKEEEKFLSDEEVMQHFVL